MSRKLSFLAVLALALMGTVAIVSPAQATNTNITIDCSNPVQGGDFYSTGHDLSFTVVNCGAVTQDWNSVSLDSNSSFTILESSLSSSRTRIRFEDLSQNVVATLNVYAGVNMSNVPNKALASTHSITLPASQPQRFVYDSTNGYTGGCSLADGSYPYQTLSLTTTIAGDFTFRISATSPDTSLNAQALSRTNSLPPIEDTWIALFSTFDPAHPAQGFLGCNDDSAQFGSYLSDGTVLSNHWSQFDVAGLPAGNYILVLAASQLYQTDSDWGTAVSGVDQTASMQLWGPVGAISTVTNPSVSNSSNTNSNSNSSSSSSSSSSNSSSSSSSSQVQGNGSNLPSGNSPAAATSLAAAAQDSSLAVTGTNTGVAISLTSVAAVALLAGAALTFIRHRIRSKEQHHA